MGIKWIVFFYFHLFSFILSCSFKVGGRLRKIPRTDWWFQQQQTSSLMSPSASFCI